MSGGYTVDLDALTSYNADLLKAAQEVDATADRMPATPDAGHLTPTIVGILDRLSTDAAKLVTEFSLAAEMITLSKDNYTNADRTTIQAMGQLGQVS